MALLDFINRPAEKLTNLKQFLSNGFSSLISDERKPDKKSKKDPNLEYYYSLNDIVYKLPFITQAANVKTRLIMSQGYSFKCKDPELEASQDEAILKKKKEDQAKLSAIFNKQNEVGQALDDLIFDGIETTELYGHSGLQAFDWENPEKITFQKVDWNQFLIVTNKLTRNDRGRKKIIYFYVSIGGFGDENGVQLVANTSNRPSSVDTDTSYKVIPFEFTHFRLNNKTLYGLSPLFFERLMTTFIVKSLQNNIDELDGNGWKGILLKGRKGLSARELGVQLEEGDDDWQNKVIQKYMNEIRRTAENATDKQFMMYLNGALVEDVIQAQKNYKSVEYMDKVNDKAAIVAASMLGIHAALLGDKDSTYASNMKPIIDYTVNVSINPSQLKYGEMITDQILNRYVNGKELLNYEYEFVLNPIDLSDPAVEAGILNTLGDFISKIRHEGVASANEAIRFINNKVKDIQLEEIESEGGDEKTTNYDARPLNFEPETDKQEPQDDDVEDDAEDVDDAEDDVDKGESNSLADKDLAEIKEDIKITALNRIYSELND